jgi:hypothetical protein
MAVSLKRAVMEILTDWPDDLPPEWRDTCGEVELGSGNADPQLELDKTFSKSVRAFIQQIVAARTDDSGYARNLADWPKTLAAIESGAVALEPASQLAQRWVDDGVLLLNFDRRTMIGEKCAGFILEEAAYREPRLAKVHRRDLGARGHSRSGRDDHEPGALCTGRRHGAGLTPAPLRVVFRRAPIGARHNAGRVW